MFDAGFTELVLIMILALVVVGPERLPGLARTVGRFVGKAQAMMSSVKAEVSQEIASDELRKALEKQVGSTGVHEILEETKINMQSLETDLNSSLETGIGNSLEPEVDRISATNSSPTSIASNTAPSSTRPTADE